MNNIITFQAPDRDRLAILIGSAQKGKIQTKVNDMVNFLISDAGGAWAEEDIMILPYGYAPKELDELIAFHAVPKMFYYLCPITPTADNEKLVWLGTYEIEKSTFAKNEKFGIEDVQMIYDSCREFMDIRDLKFNCP